VPANTFTPNRFDRLSLPLRELPIPFLCAISAFPLASAAGRRSSYAPPATICSTFNCVYGCRWPLLRLEPLFAL